MTEWENTRLEKAQRRIVAEGEIHLQGQTCKAMAFFKENILRTENEVEYFESCQIIFKLERFDFQDSQDFKNAYFHGLAIEGLKPFPIPIKIKGKVLVVQAAVEILAQEFSEPCFLPGKKRYIDFYGRLLPGKTWDESIKKQWIKETAESISASLFSAL